MSHNQDNTIECLLSSQNIEKLKALFDKKEQCQQQSTPISDNCKAIQKKIDMLYTLQPFLDGTDNHTLQKLIKALKIIYCIYELKDTLNI